MAQAEAEALLSPEVLLEAEVATEAEGLLLALALLLMPTEALPVLQAEEL